MECLTSESFEELVNTFLKSREFQFTHNALIADIKTLIESLKLANDEQKPILIRAIYKEFFSMVEADIYLINQFNPYEGYTDRTPFVPKFKKTFQKHAADFKKAALHKKYLDHEFKHFQDLINRRHDFTHPKGQLSLKVIDSDLVNLEHVLEYYRDHIHALMKGVGFQLHLPPNATPEDAARLIARIKAEDARLNAQQQPTA